MIETTLQKILKIGEKITKKSKKEKNSFGHEWWSKLTSLTGSCLGNLHSQQSPRFELSNISSRCTSQSSTYRDILSESSNYLGC